MLISEERQERKHKLEEDRGYHLPAKESGDET